MGTPEHQSQRGVQDLGTQTDTGVARSKYPAWQGRQAPAAEYLLGATTGRCWEGHAMSHLKTHPCMGPRFIPQLLW